MTELEIHVFSSYFFKSIQITVARRLKAVIIGILNDTFSIK